MVGRTIGGHVKCSVRSIFSCCLAFAILSYYLGWSSGNAAKSTCAVATRLGRVFTCDRDLTGRLPARALADIPRYPLPSNVEKGYHGIHSVEAFIVANKQNAKCSPGKQMSCFDNLEMSPSIA
jgi:hypothetical protein